MHVDLDMELMRALRFARDPKVSPAFTFSVAMQWGLARVGYYGLERALYEPQDDGPALAFIVPVVEGGELIDLAAIDGMTEHVGQRFGHGRGLGLDAARYGARGVDLVETPLEWLRAPKNVYLFRLSDVAVAFDKRQQIVVDTFALAERIQALLPPSQRARVVVAA